MIDFSWLDEWLRNKIALLTVSVVVRMCIFLSVMHQVKLMFRSYSSVRLLRLLSSLLVF
jgi:hypothetical protein